MFGWIIPAPLAVPIARIVPLSRLVCAATICFGFVSVVMIAREKSGKPVSVGLIAAIAGTMRSIGSCQPMTPVLATPISYGEQPTAFAAATAMATAFRSP